MTPDEMKDARAQLGVIWGKKRPISKAAMGRALGLGGSDPGQSIHDYERGTTKISGPISRLVRIYLRGVLPEDGVPD
jgi:hypothetical protein